MGKVSCPFCQEKINIKKKYSVISPVDKNKHTLFKCESCLLEFFHPLEIKKEVYENEVYEAYEEFHKGRNEIPDWTLKLFLYIKKLNLTHMFNKENMKILDVGAGDCVNYLALKKFFNISPQCYYFLELDNKSFEVCVKKRGLSVNKGILEFLDKNTAKKIVKNYGKFDVILATEVLEHQTKPKEFVDSLFYLLKPGGFLLITVPNGKTLFKRLKEIPYDIPPHHFLRFNKEFFIKNFKEKIVFLKEVALDKDLVVSSKVISKKIFRNNKFWFLFLPISLLNFVLSKIDKEELLVIMKNQ